MDDILNEYTAGEFLSWLEDCEIDDYITQEAIVDYDNETTLVDMPDIDKLKTDFLDAIRRYIVVKRGYRFIVHDNRECDDVMSFRFNDSNEVEVQNMVNQMCAELNCHSIRFLSGKKHCGC